jgi:hypothetical protein
MWPPRAVSGGVRRRDLQRVGQQPASGGQGHTPLTASAAVMTVEQPRPRLPAVRLLLRSAAVELCTADKRVALNAATATATASPDGRARPRRTAGPRDTKDRHRRTFARRPPRRSSDAVYSCHILQRRNPRRRYSADLTPRPRHAAGHPQPGPTGWPNGALRDAPRSAPPRPAYRGPPLCVQAHHYPQEYRPGLIVGKRCDRVGRRGRSIPEANHRYIWLPVSDRWLCGALWGRGQRGPRVPEGASGRVSWGRTRRPRRSYVFQAPEWSVVLQGGGHRVWRAWRV